MLTVSGVLCLLMFLGCLFTLMIWSFVCDDRLLTCWSQTYDISWPGYLLLGFIRPFTLMPLAQFNMMSAEAFILEGPALLGWLRILLATIASYPPLYFLGRYFHRKLVRPWLLSHLPTNLKKAQNNTFLLTLMSRSLVFLHYDLTSLIYGLFGLSFTQTLRATVLIELVKVTTLCLFVYTTKSAVQGFLYYLIFGISVVFIITVTLQIITYAGGNSWLRRCYSYYHDTYCEIRANNDIRTEETFTSKNPPILLLYGFFASRRTLTVMEKLLKQKGYDVISLNLGGLFDVFFIDGIIDTAKLVNRQLEVIMERHNLSQVHIVAHSKGGLVAAWWALRLGGYRVCKNIITMGTPFGGTYYTWLALVTPLGLLWKDVWQMRPRSQFLNALRDSVMPDDLKIHCFYSARDRIAFLKRGIFRPRYGCTQGVVPVAMHKISHFEYLFRKSVVEQIHHILSEGTPLHSDNTVQQHAPPPLSEAKLPEKQTTCDQKKS